jgi:hypothetical protein
MRDNDLLRSDLHAAKTPEDLQRVTAAVLIEILRTQQVLIERIHEMHSDLRRR